VVTTTFASTEAATRLINAVKRMHGRVEGVRPDGVPYRALDPELIGWVHTCIPWGVMEAYHRYRRPLTESERNRYLSEQAIIGRMGGAGRIPETVAELDEYVEAMRPKLAVNHQTLEFFDFLMEMPFGIPVPAPLSPAAHRFQVEAAMSLMPKWARELTSFDVPELLLRSIHHPALRAYAQTVRWAFGTPQYAAMARERATATDGGRVRTEAAA
jgi:uncharacterized protein (DUF2236 family)